MAKSLIITEKPSVAQDIARALGGMKKNRDYFEGAEYVISWAVGHLFELAVPAALKAQDKWALDKLPILPVEFDLAPEERTASRVKVLLGLMAKKEITEVINACDAGREGELIFRYIYQYAQCAKPIRRLWLSSMTTDAIRDSFGRLRSDEELQPLARAARCRNEADWLVGINATRAFTLRLSGGKGSTITSLGRVQTPTLAIIVERERKILDFKPRAVWEVFADFAAAAGTYRGRWFDETYRKDEDEPARTTRLLERLGVKLPAAERLGPDSGSLWDEHRAATRLWIAELAEAIVQRCQGQPGVVELEEKKPSTSMCPPLYDLTALQREANNRFGFSARRTLQIAQTLYERYKALTYPRTDSRCLPEDYVPTVKITLKKLADTPVGPFAARVLEQGWVRPNKRVFNNAKVSDHFAIIPTGNVPEGLERDEAAVYELVSKRFVAVFFPPAEFEITTRITRVAGEPFKTEGKILRVPGWLEVYGRESTDKPEENLPPVTRGEQVATERVEAKADQTKPPARYTEATILSAMEGAGKLVEDEELAEAMKEKGLGTPATRASIIETLIAAHYLQRHEKELQPTPKAITTIGLLKSIPVNELVSPELTGEWEYRLREIEHQKLTREQFMADIRQLTTDIVRAAKEFEPDEHVGDTTPFGACPKCGQPLLERFKSYQCTGKGCEFSLWKTLAGRLLSREEAETLIRDGKIGPLPGFRSKAGKRFDAILKLNEEFKIVFDFEATTAAAMTNVVCDKCGAPMIIRSGKRGEFLACSAYPKCRNAKSFTRDAAGVITAIEKPKEVTTEIKCDKCGAPMLIKSSRRGPFLACSAYPKCKNAKPLPDDLKSQAPPPPPRQAPIPTDEKCEKCGAPMLRRRGRFGEFLGCSAYPKCKNIKKLAAPAS